MIKMGVSVESALSHRFGLGGRRALVTGRSVSIGRAIAYQRHDAP
jgi:hypothetical protein